MAVHHVKTLQGHKSVSFLWGNNWRQGVTLLSWHSVERSTNHWSDERKRAAAESLKPCLLKSFPLSTNICHLAFRWVLVSNLQLSFPLCLCVSNTVSKQRLSGVFPCVMRYYGDLLCAVMGRKGRGGENHYSTSHTNVLCSFYLHNWRVQSLPKTSNATEDVTAIIMVNKNIVVRCSFSHKRK